MGSLFGCTAFALVLVTLIACVALADFLRGHALSDIDWLVAADVCLVVLAAAAVVRLVSLKRGCLVLGRLACAFAIVYYNQAIKPGTWLDAYAGHAVMLACLASYAALGTRFAKKALALCLAPDPSNQLEQVETTGLPNSSSSSAR